MNVLMKVLKRILFARKMRTFLMKGDLRQNFQRSTPTTVPTIKMRTKTKISPRL